MKRLLFIMFFLSFMLPVNLCLACDDTLVMLLTAKNPNSEFSKVIRSFTTNLTALGLGLKNNQNEEFEKLLLNTMESWLGFTKKYSNNPPPEAKNDSQWADKMRNTGKSIGEIRKLIKTKKYTEAHDLVLELNGKIGQFFEAFGVSDEKQLFIKVSSDITRTEQMQLRNDFVAMKESIGSLKSGLVEFQKFLPASGELAKLRAEAGIASLTKALEEPSPNSTELNQVIQKLRIDFEEMRSHILMQEWFPATDKGTQGEKE